jgi:tetratricopeptide (TPR) repeat protein
MAGGASPSPLKKAALDALARGDGDAPGLIAKAVTQMPGDGALLIADAAASMRAGAESPFARIESVLERAPDWVEGHKALCRLKTEASDPQPFASIEAALRKQPQNPKLWMAYLTMLGAASRHADAASHAKKLRKDVADPPPLRLLEARHRGFAGEPEAAEELLAGLPEDLPELAFEQARNAMRLGEFDRADELLGKVRAQAPGDIGAWALTELCWRALADPLHYWLVHDRLAIWQVGLGLSQNELSDLAETLRALHITRAAPLGQSVKGGTQTHGNLHLRRDAEIGRLFEAIEAALRDYAERLSPFDPDHPLAPLKRKPPQITASWSIRLTDGGRHVPHLHDGGRISSAAHIAVPGELSANDGMLELGRPPEDIPMTLEPLAQVTPKPGHLVLFPSYVYHSTAPFPAGERLTVAFDAV